MAIDSKPNTISAPEENATSNRSRRVRWLVAGLNLVLVPVLLILFVAIVESRRMEPMHSWIQGTPLETAGARIGRMFSKRVYRLGKGIGADKARHAEALIDRMAAAMPSHAAVTKDRETIFAQIAERDENMIVFERVDGLIGSPRKVAADDLVMLKLIALPEVVLTERDVDFLLATPDSLHVCLPPLLVSTTEGYAQAHNLHLTLSLLEQAIRVEFAPLISDHEQQRPLVHVMQSPEGAPAASTHFGSDNAWYDSLTRRLVVRSGLGDIEYDRLVRHEGAHEICDRLKIVGDYDAAPLWLREGVAQYCETSPLGGKTFVRTQQLIRSMDRGGSWDDLVKPTSIETLPHGTASDFYARSWFLVAWLMSPPRRALFFRWIVETGEKPSNGKSMIGIMNAVGSTASQLDKDLHDFCQASRASGP